MKASKRPALRIVGTGLIALDVVYVDGAEKPGLVATGGTAGNVLMLLAAFGWRATPLSRLADDPAANLIKAELKKWNLELGFLQTAPQAPTPIIIERLTREPSPRHSFSWTCPCCGGWLPRFAPLGVRAVEALADSLPPADVFFFDRPFPGALKLAAHYAANGAVVVFEPSGSSEPHIFRKALDLAHVVKYAAERFSKLPAELDELPHGRIEIQTLGGSGLRYRTRLNNRAATSWKEERSFAVDGVVDTAGSGDWFTAGFLRQLFKERSTLVEVREPDVGAAVNYGQAVAAWNCRFLGARGGMSPDSWERMDKEVEDILKQRVLKLSPERQRRTARVIESICPACTAEQKRDRKTAATI